MIFLSRVDGPGKRGSQTWRSEVAEGAKLPRHQAAADIEHIHGHRLGFEIPKHNFEMPGRDRRGELEGEGTDNTNACYRRVQRGLGRTHHQT